MNDFIILIPGTIFVIVQIINVLFVFKKKRKNIQ